MRATYTSPPALSGLWVGTEGQYLQGLPHKWLMPMEAVGWEMRWRGGLEPSWIISDH